MSVIQALLLGLLQGITEFLPVSSSGHLKLAEMMLGLKNLEQLVFFDLICHLGTLGAIVIVLRKEIRTILFEDREELLRLIIATAPLFPLVFAVKAIKSVYGEPHLLGYFFLLSSVLMITGEKLSRPKPIKGRLSALWIGLAQCLALFPAVSRSGSTIAMGRFLGWERVKAAKFSFLLSIPTILGGVGLESLKIIAGKEALPSLPIFIYIIGFVISLGVGSFMLKAVLILFKRVSLIPFAVYTALVGVLALIVL